MVQGVQRDQGRLRVGHLLDAGAKGLRGSTSAVECEVVEAASVVRVVKGIIFRTGAAF